MRRAYDRLPCLWQTSLGLGAVLLMRHAPERLVSIGTDNKNRVYSVLFAAGDFACNCGYRTVMDLFPDREGIFSCVIISQKMAKCLLTIRS